MSPKLRWFCSASLALALSAPIGRSTVLDPDFSESSYYATGGTYLAATGMEWAPDGSGRLFVLRKGGEVRIVQNGAMVATPFVSESVYTNSECGLIGMAFDPGFASNGYVYFFLTVSSSEQQIVRYTASGNIGTNRTVIVSGLPTRGVNHDGGGLGVGRDGKLYWAVGDLGNRTGVDLNTSTLAAKVGRANRDGSVPADNPFAGGPNANDDFIFAGGLRNPFTMTFQPGTGALWVNVVGDSYEQVMVVGPGDNGGYDNVENGVPSGPPSPYAQYLTPVVKFRTNGSDSRNITTNGAVRTSNVVTITTTSAHGFRVGEQITVSGVSDASFNGTIFVATISSPTSFTFGQAGPDASSGSPGSPVATATTQYLGGSITGGTFMNTTAVPASYRGDFFFGDFNSGRVIRTALDGSSAVEAVTHFASGSSMIDLAVGPDGALYGLQYNGDIRRWTYSPSVQGLVVTPAQLQTDEGSKAVFSVRLAQPPAANTVVSVARVAGDSDVYVQAGNNLTFTPANWQTPQAVTIQSLDDDDAVDDVATFAVSSSGIPTENVNVFALDPDAPSIVVSSATISVVEGASASFTVNLSGPPDSPVLLSATRSSGDVDLSVTDGASLVFNAENFSEPQSVEISAAEDGDALNGEAIISVAGSGFSTRTVTATEQDNDTLAPVITSTALTTAVNGALYTYDVDASGNPAPTCALVTAPAGMTISPGSGVISWTPGSEGAFAVEVSANNGVLPAASQGFTIQVGADQPPEALLTRPYEGEFVSGSSAEFFGDGLDDVGTVRAEFYVDGGLEDTDINSSGHYHIGGTHNQWDTTGLSNGGHRVRITVYDGSGQSASVERDVIVANGISRWQAWRLAKFNAAELADSAVSGDIADWDGDGLTTLMEYAFGRDPKVPDPSSPELGMDGDQLTLTFTTVLGATDLTYDVMGADNLTDIWSAAGFTLIDTESLGALERRTYRDGTVLGPDDRRFLRVRVIRVDP